jgi:acetylornithine deacetylase/succinyl-diaminopimelate desuccinylase-like protein
MAEVLRRLDRMTFSCAPYPALPALPRLNVGSIVGGRGPDYLSEPPYVPDHCTIVVDVHFVPGQKVDDVIADVAAVLDEIKHDDPSFNYGIEMPPPAWIKGRRRLVMDPVDVPVDAEVVRVIADSYQKVSGRQIDRIGAVLPTSYSACDTSWLCKAGIPSVNYGPLTEFASSGPEGACVVISEMETVAKVMARAALQVCMN